MELKNKNAIVTGGSLGFGYEISKTFVQQGANVIICARDKVKLGVAVDQLKSFLPPHTDQKEFGIATDVSDEKQVKNLIDVSINKLTTIHILVNNAGIYGPKGSIDEINSEEWVRAITINLIAPFYVLHHILPHMKKNGYGKIVNVSGGGATLPLPMISAYAASKAGLVRLTETIAEELRSTGIDINSIAPGALNTRLLDEVLQAGPEKVGKLFYDRAVNQKKTGGAPLSKGAELAVFLASSRSDGISGKLISAIWDPWKELSHHKEDLHNSDIYTLRRILPKERGKDWENKYQ